jgi:hypothetical protein
MEVRTEKTLIPPFISKRLNRRKSSGVKHFTNSEATTSLQRNINHPDIFEMISCIPVLSGISLIQFLKALYISTTLSIMVSNDNQ